jgi:hypothetical protein
MAMTALPYVAVPAGNIDVIEAEYLNWDLLDSSCEIFEIDENTLVFDENAPIGPPVETDDLALSALTAQIAVCTFTNDHPTGFMTGGGKIYPTNAEPPTDQVTHGFELHCDPSSGPNTLEVNWDGNKFHLDSLVLAECVDDGTVNEPPSNGNGNKPTLDVYHGIGTGRFNGVCGATAEWIFDDNGEPGKWDQIVSLVITDGSGVLLSINPDVDIVDYLSTPSQDKNNPDNDESPFTWWDLDSGNHQWVPHPSKKHSPNDNNTC